MSEEAFPAVFEASGAPGAFVFRFRSEIEAALRRVGAVLLRGLDAPDAVGFDAVVRAFGYRGFTYEESLSNAVRVSETERVFTANEAPKAVAIELHHEMAQTPRYPSHLFFFCQVAPDAGGETPLLRSDHLLAALREEHGDFVADCETHGLRYTLVMPASDDVQSGQGRSWRSTLGVSVGADAEARLQRLGYTFTWLEDGALRATTPVLPAIRRTSDGTPAFFNQLIAAHRSWSRERDVVPVTFGDGRPLPDAPVERAAELARGLRHDHRWQARDVVLLDNLRVMHGRRPFEGARRVLASLVDQPV